MITIALLTIGETIRKKILWVLIALAVVAVILTAWGVTLVMSAARQAGTSDLQIKLGVSQVLIFIAFQFDFVLAMTAAFLGSPAIAADLESGVAQAVLARPLRRSSYLVGRWLGLATVVALYAALSGLLAIAAVALVSGYTPPNILSPVAYLAGQAIILLTFTIVFSTRLPAIAGGAIAVVAYGIAWLAGVLGHIGIALGTNGLVGVSDLARILLPTDTLWQGVVYGLEPSVVIATIGQAQLAQGNPFFAAEPPPTAFVLWAVAWIVLALGLATVLLRRREL
ncbi:MAG TPA: ABC transporter permease [Candidatus Limnocylindrales bacterium]|jgi:ABC-type transport system involved in multi-copper enzyme maturation permease subunit|nr:ABC transporter permease [Candidatus Limnocylindrales bacterium]